MDEGDHEAAGGPRAYVMSSGTGPGMGRQVRSRHSMGMSQWGQRDRSRGPRQPLLIAQIQKIVAQLLITQD
ncbi:MAG: hypothetical protein PHI93_11470, partial [Kiritimatiellae bacterium]|nr:hypothetical protein [Kiritimatiellia bacterium]